MNKIIKILILLSVCFLTQQSNATPFKKIFLALGAIPAFHIAKFVHFSIMANKIINKAKKNEYHFQHSSSTTIRQSKEGDNFNKQLIESAKKRKYNKILNALHEYNNCLEAVIEQNTCSQEKFNFCNEYGLESLKKS